MPRGRGGKSKTMASVTLTDEQFRALLGQIQLAATETRQQTTSPVSSVQVMPNGNFVKCTNRFSGSKDEDVNAFISAIETFKDCSNISEENAIKGVPILLTDLAATWWLGIKSTIRTWEEVIAALRNAFGKKKPPYLVYQMLFKSEQDDTTPTDIFVCRARALLAEIPDTLTEKVQVDMVYGLLNRRIRKRVMRDDIETFEDLLTKARSVEQSQMEAVEKEEKVKSSVSTTEKEKKSNTKPAVKCAYCKNFGHLVKECQIAQRKNDKRGIEQPAADATHKPRITCYGCGAAGVIRSKCPTCTKTTKQSDTKAQADAVEFYMIDLATIDESTAKNGRPVLPIEIDERKGLAIVDTGAQVSIAGRKLYDLLIAQNYLFARETIQLAYADGVRQAEEAEKIQLPVKVADRVVHTTFFALPKLTHNVTLLGIDFIKEAKLVLDPGNMSWSFADRPTQTYPFANHYPVTANVMEVVADTRAYELRSSEGADLASDQRKQLNALLVKYHHNFKRGGEVTPFAEHSIDTGLNAPVAVPPYQLSSQKKAQLRVELDQMIHDGILEECESPWAAPVVLVPKPDGRIRLCADYRKLNAITKADKYPLPRLEDLLHAAKKTNFITTLDLKWGYWQVPVRKEDRDKTAIVTPYGMFRFRRMPFGLKNAPATFQRLMDRFKAGLKDVIALVYLDDLIIISDTFEQHLKDLETVFKRLKSFNLQLNREKCQFACEKVQYLGHIITSSGIQVNPEKIRAVLDMKPPRNVKELKTFLQTCSWFRKFIPDFSRVAKSLTDLLKKKSEWKWDEAQQKTFSELKRLLTSAPILRQADDRLPYIVRTDASDHAIGAVLVQGDKHDERPVEYASRLLTSAERNYSTTEKEALAVVWAMNKFRGYVECSPVTVITDHQPLRWLMTLKSPTGRLARWALQLQGYDLQVQYTPGTANVVADTLSRPPRSDDEGNVCLLTADVPIWTAEDMRNKQLEDPEIAKIMDSLEAVTPTSDSDRWVDRGYTLSKGVLYRYVPENESDEAQLVIPDKERLEILKVYHDAPTAGHEGSERTYLRISARYYWPGMRRQITEYVKACPACQKYKAITQKPAGLLQTPVYNRRFEVVAIDLFGPLPETKLGNKWIMIVQDTASGWVELFAVAQATAMNCAKILIDEVILRYGAPRRIISDNGAQFVSEIMQQVCYVFNITQSLTSTYHPQSNPVERKNRDLKPQLAIQVGMDHDTWDEKLATIRFAMNSSVSHSTGYTASYLTFGREMRTIDDSTHDLREVVSTDNFVPEVTPYLQRFSRVLREARGNHDREQDRQKKYADKHRRPAPTYEVGAKVLLKTHTLSSARRGFTSKFAPRRDGPYLIRRQVAPETYEVVQPQKPEEVLATVHSSDLTPFVESPGETVEPVVPRRRRGRPPKQPKT